LILYERVTYNLMFPGLAPNKAWIAPMTTLDADDEFRLACQNKPFAGILFLGGHAAWRSQL